MRPSDNLMPYILSSMHPLIHMSMLITNLILLSYDHKQFFKIKGKCKSKSAADYFKTEGKYTFTYQIICMHCLAIVCHYGYQVLYHY